MNTMTAAVIVYVIPILLAGGWAWWFGMKIRASNKRLRRMEELGKIVQDITRPFPERHAAMDEILALGRQRR